MRSFFIEVANRKNVHPEFCNHLIIERSPYVIAAVMDESVNDEPLVFSGLFCDMYSPAFDIITEKILYPGEKCILSDLMKVKGESEIIGTSVRVNEINVSEDEAVLKISGAKMRRANIRIKLPFIPEKAYIDKNPAELSYDSLSKTALISFMNEVGDRELLIK